MPPASDLRWTRRAFAASGLAFAAGGWAGCRALEPSDPRLTARPGDPTVTPSLGATSLGLGAARDGLLYVAASIPPGTAAPLLVLLHGAGGSSAAWGSYQARAEARGMVLLVPDSRGPTWDLILGTVGPDVQFINQALAHTFARCRIDPDRVALGGFSDGASYAIALGLSNGDLFSRLIGYSPGFLALPDEPVGKPRVFVSHGTADPVLPVGASRDVVVPNLRARGYDVTYREFAGVHEVPAPISEAALDWFLG